MGRVGSWEETGDWEGVIAWAEQGPVLGGGRSREGTEGKSLGGEHRQEPGSGRRQLDMGLGGA